MREIDFDQKPTEEINFQNPILPNIRLCKAIAPNNDNVTGGEIRNRWGKVIGRYSDDKPRIVKSGFQVPSNWHVLIEYEDLEEIIVNSSPITKRYLGREQTLVHRCKKPYTGLSDLAGGFYAQWSPTDRVIEKEVLG